MSTSNHPKSLQTDAQLLREFLRAGDEASDVADSAFAEIVRRHQGIVWGVCHRALSNRCDAEDAFQMTFGLLARKADRIRKPAALGSWLHGVALKTANRIRQRQRTLRRKTVVMPNELIGPTLEPFEEIALKHQIDQIDQQLQSLGEKYRIPIVLFYYLNRTTSQIAHELSLSVTAVEGRLKRGRQQLKRGMLRHGTQLSIPISTLASVAPPTELADKAATLAEPQPLHGPSNRQSLPTILGGTSMFTKATLTAAAALLFTVGTIMHARPTDQRDSRLTSVAPESQQVQSEPVEVGGAIKTDTPSAPIWRIELKPKSLHQRIHDHLIQAHNQFFSWLTSSVPTPHYELETKFVFDDVALNEANSIWLDLDYDSLSGGDNWSYSTTGQSHQDSFVELHAVTRFVGDEQLFNGWDNYILTD